MKKNMATAALLTGIVALGATVQPAHAAADQGFVLRGPGSSKMHGHFQVWGGGVYVRQAECKISIATGFRASGTITVRRYDDFGTMLWQQTKSFNKANAGAGLRTPGDNVLQSTEGDIVCDVQATVFKRGKTWGAPHGTQSFNVY